MSRRSPVVKATPMMNFAAISVPDFTISPPLLLFPDRWSEAMREPLHSFFACVSNGLSPLFERHPFLQKNLRHLLRFPPPRVLDHCSSAPFSRSFSPCSKLMFAYSVSL